MYYRYGHCAELKVKKGDKVKKGQKVATVGTGEGQYSAHLHFDIPVDKLASWTNYVFGMSKEQVAKAYADPNKYIKTVLPNFTHFGWEYLEYATYGSKTCYHPGVDLNSGGGNTDLGHPIYSACDGEVEYVYNGTGTNSGWGKLLIIKEAKSKEVLGIDISHYQGKIDWDKVKKAGVTFAIQKCSQGTNYKDPTFEENKKEIRKAGILFGSYHYAQPDDAIKEADHYIKSVGDIRNGELLVLDWEKTHSNPPAWCKKFLDRVKEKTGVKPYLYTYESKLLSLRFEEIANEYPLWIAKYGTNDGTKQKKPDSGLWKDWDIWQYTSRGKVDGIEGNVDLDIAKNLIIKDEDMPSENFVKRLGELIGKDIGKRIDEKDEATVIKKLQEMNDKLDSLDAKVKNQSEMLVAYNKKIDGLEEENKKLKEEGNQTIEAMGVLKALQIALKKLLELKF